MKTLIIFLLVVVTIFSCTTSRDNKALSRVLNNVPLSERAYAQLVKQHPIKIDTVYKTIRGKDVITYDTVEVAVYYTDTLIDVQQGRVDTLFITRTKNILRVDTVIHTVPDSRLLDAANTRITVLQTQLKASQDSDTAHKKGKLHWILASIGLFIILASVIYIGLKK